MTDKNIPQHIAIIMDGNGRWAQQRGLLRTAGHAEGVKRLEEVVRAATEAGVAYLTFYAFSKENWNRPVEEVDFLMALLERFTDEDVERMIENGVSFRTIGSLEDLKPRFREKLQDAIKRSSGNKGIVVNVALSYSSRDEILRAVQKTASQVESGKLKVAELDEKVFASYLDTAELPDPDLLIRTSGEMRISNYLLWQLSYAELYFTPTLWPDFKKEEFHKALEVYNTRERRFGLTSAQRGSE